MHLCIKAVFSLLFFLSEWTVNPFRYKPDKEIFIAVSKDISFIFSLLLFAIPTDARRSFSLTTSFYDNLFSYQGAAPHLLLMLLLSFTEPKSSTRFSVFVEICCKLMPVSLYLSFFCLFGFVSFLLCLLSLRYPFFCFFKFIAQFPPKLCFFSFPALPPLLVYAVAYVCTSAYI